MTRHIAFLIYRDFQLLDAAGPIAAFEIAARYEPGSYSLRVVAAEPGSVTSSSGVSLQAAPFARARGVDTLVVAGGDGSRSAILCAKTRRFIQTCASRARRTTSVCSGSYLLAAAGLLDGRRATTHWSRATDFARKFPLVRVEPDRIFVKDGSFWTSAGISAGIDLSLAMIEEDLGESVARRTAQQLVVYYRRPGGTVAVLRVVGDGACQWPFRGAARLCTQPYGKTPQRRGPRGTYLHESKEFFARLPRGDRDVSRQSYRAVARRDGARLTRRQRPFGTGRRALLRFR
jgi:transcriptional regulator GlxA family with amidase domain